MRCRGTLLTLLLTASILAGCASGPAPPAPSSSEPAATFSAPTRSATSVPAPPPIQLVPALAPYTVTGDANFVTGLFTTERSLIHINVNGTADDCGKRAYFLVWVLDNQGNRLALWVNEVGTFAGDRYYLLPPGDHALESRSGNCGHWALSVGQPGTTDAAPQDAAATGQHQPPCFRMEGTAQLSFHTLGKGNFVVRLLDYAGTQSRMLVNAIGDYNGTVPVQTPAGTYCLDVDVDPHTAWTLKTM